MSVLRLSTASRLAFMTALLALGACAVGPDFETPAAPDVATYDSTQTPAATSDGAQTLQMGGTIPAEWWGLFHSDGLNALIRQSLAHNPDLAAADAALRVANDELAAGSADLFPVVSGSFSSTRQKQPGAAYGGSFPSLTYTLHNASVSVAYGLDLWGGTRRGIEALQAQADQAGFQKEAAYLSLTANVVTASIQEASLRDQIAATQDIIADQEKVLKILQARFEAGAVAKTQVVEQEANLANFKTTLPPLQHQLAVTRHLLSVLAGQMPQQEPGVTFTLDNLTLPAQMPLSLPSQLVEQRPDIRAAREQLHAASAQIGVAVANRLPTITLSADLGTMANQIGKLFSPGTGLWSYGASAGETLFDAGALADKEEAARDTFLQAAAIYQKTVLAAFQDVADALHALQSDSDSLNAKLEADKAAQQSLSLVKTQCGAGAVTMAELLNAQQAAAQSKIALVQARAQRYADSAALLAALGGGWWNRVPADAEQTAAPVAEPVAQSASEAAQNSSDGDKHD